MYQTIFSRATPDRDHALCVLVCFIRVIAIYGMLRDLARYSPTLTVPRPGPRGAIEASQFWIATRSSLLPHL